MALNDSAELLDVIRLRGSIPTNNPDWPAAKVLAQASRELLETYLPLLVQAKGEYLVKTEDLVLTGGLGRYRLNDRCAAVRMVSRLVNDGRLVDLDEAPPGRLVGMQNVNTKGTISHFTFAEHSIELYPLPNNSNDKVRVRWHIRPSRICEVTETAAITAITANTPTPGQTTITFATPTGLSLWPSAARFDLVKSTSPFDVLAWDLAPVGSTAVTRVFATADLPSELEVGDYIAPARYTPFANVPEELHQPIALRTAAAIINAKDDGLAQRLVSEAASKDRALLNGILAPRSKGNAKRLVSRYW